jgi:hypothetical protein
MLAQPMQEDAKDDMPMRTEFTRLMRLVLCLDSLVYFLRMASFKKKMGDLSYMSITLSSNQFELCGGGLSHSKKKNWSLYRQIVYAQRDFHEYIRLHYVPDRDDILKMHKKFSWKKRESYVPDAQDSDTEDLPSADQFSHKSVPKSEDPELEDPELEDPKLFNIVSINRIYATLCIARDKLKPRSESYEKRIERLIAPVDVPYLAAIGCRSIIPGGVPFLTLAVLARKAVKLFCIPPPQRKEAFFPCEYEYETAMGHSDAMFDFRADVEDVDGMDA